MKVTCTAFDPEVDVLTFVSETGPFNGAITSRMFTKSTQEIKRTASYSVDDLPGILLAVMLLFDRHFGGDFNDLVGQSVIW